MHILPRIRSCWFALPLIVAALLSLTSMHLQALDPPLAVTGAERTRVVLLKNDRCLTGLVRQLGDQVMIEIDESARVSKAASDIQFIADDLEGIYQHKLARYAHLGPGENIRLARWCLAVGLNEHAAQHFLAVHREAGENPLVKQLGVELRDQLLSDESFRLYLGLEPLRHASGGGLASSVHTASSVATDNLMPIAPTVVTVFTDQVQPILLNRCSQSGCHGLSATNRLKIIAPIGTARARISEQNCRSALQFVAVDDSNMSVLLRYALGAHGIQKTASITTQEPRLMETLQSWTTFARNPVVAAVDQHDTSPGTAPAVYSDPARSGVPASGLPSNRLSPLGPGALELRKVPRPPKFGVQPDYGQPQKSELDELDEQVRRAMGERPRDSAASESGTPATVPLPDLTSSAISSPALTTGAATIPAAPRGLPSGQAGSRSSVTPASPVRPGSTVRGVASPAGMPVSDPFDPAEFNRAVAARAQPSGN